MAQGYSFTVHGHDCRSGTSTVSELTTQVAWNLSACSLPTHTALRIKAHYFFTTLGIDTWIFS